MRVLQVGLSENIGGIETFVMSYFRELVKQGVVFDFIDMYGNGLAFADEIIGLGGKIFTLPNYKKHPFYFMKEMERVLRSEKYACVHMNMLSAANLLPLKVTLKCGCIPIVHSHNSGTEGILRSLLHKKNVKKLRKYAKIRLSCGEKAGEWMFGKYPFKVIPNAIDVEKFSFDINCREMIRKEIGVSEETYLLGFVGRLSNQKNPKYLVDILSAVKDGFNKPIKLVIVGDGELKREVADYADESGCKDNIIFAGIKKDVGAWYSAMDCLLLPSLYEGFVIVAIEAQANGLPCFVSDSVSRETKISNRFEFLPLSKSAEEWKASILNTVAENEMRKNGMLRNTIYDIKVSASELCEIYKNCDC